MDLQKERQFVKSRVADQIAMLYVYMPMIREEVFQFVDVWNAHYIRKQPNRPSCVYGIPNKLYDYPIEGSRLYNIEISSNIVNHILGDLPKWGKLTLDS